MILRRLNMGLMLPKKLVLQPAPCIRFWVVLSGLAGSSHIGKIWIQRKRGDLLGGITNLRRMAQFSHEMQLKKRFVA